MKLGLSLFLLLLSFSATAKEYDLAGCGLGSVLWNTEPKTHFVLIMESSTNQSLGTQSSGILLDSSHCVDSKSLTSKNDTKIFIASNREALAKDIARGQG